MIDELELVRRLNADVDPPSHEARAAARAALAASVARESVPRRASRRQAPQRQAPQRQAPRRRAWALRAGLVAAAVCALGLVIGLSGSDSPTAPTTAAAAVLQRLATVAAATPRSSYPGPGQYLYVDSRQANESDAPEVGCTMLVSERRRIWIGANGSGRLLETYAGTSYPSAADRSACQRAKIAPLNRGQRSDTWFAPRCLTDGPVDERTLPTDPAVLRRELTARKIEGGPPGAAEDFTQVGDLLRETDASPALRAALFRVAATIPGVRSVGTVSDHAGRHGLGLAFVTSGGTGELIFNRSTSALMGELYSDAAGRTTGWTVYLRSAIVNSVPGNSPLPLRPACNPTGSGTDRQAPSGVGVMVGTSVS